MSTRQTYKGILSILVMLTIAICNVSSDIWNSIKISDPSWDLYGTITVITQWGLPLLISLIGMIYLDRDIYYSTSMVYKKLLPQATIACGFWWIISALIQLKTNHSNEMDFDTFLECMGKVLYEPFNIFLLQLFVIMFAFYPLLTRIVSNNKLLFYALVTSFVICMFFPAIEQIPYIRYINLFTNQINWNFFTSYGFYLLFGIWVMRTNFDWHHRIVVYCSGVLSSVAMITLTKIISASLLDIDSRYVNISSPFVVFQALAVMVLLKQIISTNFKTPILKIVTNELAYNIYGYIVTFVIINNIISYYISSGIAFLLPLCSCIATNIVCAFLRRLPIVSFLFCEFKIRGDRI